jgi:hypothetical protein
LSLGRAVTQPSHIERRNDSMRLNDDEGRLNVRCDPLLREQLERLAALQERQTVSGLVREICTRFVLEQQLNRKAA